TGYRVLSRTIINIFRIKILQMKFDSQIGLIAAPFTPMSEDGSLNTALVPDYYRFQTQNGVFGAFINGSTGEGVSLTKEEKKRVAEAWASATASDTDFKVINLVGGVSVEEAKELAKYTEELGLYAVSFTAPFYFKPGTAAALADCCKQVAAAAPDTAFYYYHIPVLTG